jgi:hypothetical protein
VSSIIGRSVLSAIADYLLECAAGSPHELGAARG